MYFYAKIILAAITVISSPGPRSFRLASWASRSAIFSTGSFDASASSS